MDSEAIIEKFNLQKKSQTNSPLKDVNYRIRLLRKLYKNIKLLQKEIFEALKMDLNKSEVESYMCEVGLVLNEISFMLKHIKSYSKPKRVATPLAQFRAESYKLACPYGTVLIISPWNYPFMLSVEPLVDALSAGNSIILKPSEYSPNVSKVLEKLISQTFLPSEASVVLGGKEECSLLLDQDFDYIFYTGSTRVGEIVMKKAAEQIGRAHV